jgi:hypothetical protein
VTRWNHWPCLVLRRAGRGRPRARYYLHVSSGELKDFDLQSTSEFWGGNGLLLGGVWFVGDMEHLETRGSCKNGRLKIENSGFRFWICVCVCMYIYIYSIRVGDLRISGCQVFTGSHFLREKSTFQPFETGNSRSNNHMLVKDFEEPIRCTLWVNWHRYGKSQCLKANQL